MDKENNNIKNNLWGLLGTLIFHGLLLWLMVIIIYRTPIPPFPEDGGGGGGNGLEINLGNSEQGMGKYQFANLSIPSFENKKIAAEPVAEEVQKAKTDVGEDILTQETEEAISVPSTPTVKKVKPNDKPTVSKPKPKAEPVQPVVNPNALYKKNKGSGNTNVPGNQGREDGSSSGSTYSGKGSGSGTGSGTGSGSGSGSGSGNGTGSGTGNGVGSGINYTLEGRVPKSLLKPSYNSEDQGKVVVTIWVNKEGKVIKAIAGGKGTSTSDQKLWKMAEDAAKRSSFASKSDAAEEQKGTITYKFVKSK
jgi:outer membrane biosynthesis protein TonB